MTEETKDKNLSDTVEFSHILKIIMDEQSKLREDIRKSLQKNKEYIKTLKKRS